MNARKSWSEVRVIYEGMDGPRARELLALARQIEASRYAEGLFGDPGFASLYIRQVPKASGRETPYLKVTPGADGTVEFRYVDTCVEERQWHRTVQASDAFNRLKRFVEELHWFVRDSSETRDMPTEE